MIFVVYVEKKYAYFVVNLKFGIKVISFESIKNLFRRNVAILSVNKSVYMARFVGNCVLVWGDSWGHTYLRELADEPGGSGKHRR